ncbi:MAG: TonB-dependent receptor [Proteobacteria bacterium]|nr:TonB-dependent receptor [Pseudomonadota bacterium]
MSRLSSFHATVLAIALCAGPSWAATQVGAKPVALDIAAQPVGLALTEFGKQTGLHVVVDSDLAKGVTSSGVHGHFTPSDALGRLLASTGLEFRFVDENTVAVVAPAHGQSPAATQTLGTTSSYNDTQTSAGAKEMGGNSAPPENSNARTQKGQTTGSQATPAPGKPALEAIGLDEVVVTAQKRSENIQDVPSSVSVVNKDLLDNLHVTQLADVGAYVPGLQVVSAGTPGQTTVIIRGVAPLGSGATVGTYINDTPVGGSSGYSRNTNFALDLLPYDVERMEVLRGPQGTLYGASTMGGLLKYILTEPDTKQLHVRVGADGFGINGAGTIGGGARAMINAPLVQDRLAMVASYAVEQTPGYIDSAQTGARDQNSVKQQSGRLSFLWQPAEKLSVTLGALYQRIDANGSAEIALTPTKPIPLPVAGDLKDNNYFEQPFYKRISYQSLTVNWDLDWADFVSASSYADTLTTQTQDVTRTYGQLYPLFGEPAGLSAFLIQLGLRKYTQEFRLTSPSGSRLEWLAGVFYTHEDSANKQLLTAQQLNGASLVSLDPLFIGSIPSTYKEYAGFGDLTFHFTDRFDVGGGVRYAKNLQTFRQTSSGSIVAPADNPGSSSEGVWTYSGTSSFHFSKDSMLYARVASGYQPGGPNVVLPDVPPSYQSSTLTNYEAGLKSQFMERRALLDIAAFRINWSNVQISATNTEGFSFFTNGGTARSQGVEANSSLRVTDRLTLSATGAYDEATLTANAPSVGGLSGDRLTNIPKWSGSLRGDYTQPVFGDWQVRAGAGLRMVGERLSAVAHSKYSFRLPGYSAVDLNTDLSNDRWTVRLFVKNVGDKRAYLGYSVLTDGLTGQTSQLLGAPLQPRTVGISVDASF